METNNLKAAGDGQPLRLFSGRLERLAIELERRVDLVSSDCQQDVMQRQYVEARVMESAMRLVAVVNCLLNENCKDAGHFAYHLSDGDND